MVLYIRYLRNMEGNNKNNGTGWLLVNSIDDLGKDFQKPRVMN